MKSNKEQNFALMVKNILERNIKLDNTPVQLMFGLTNVCNLHCSFCPYCGFCMAKIEMVSEIPVALLENIKPYLSNAKFVNPSGRGEPFLYKHFEEFIDICRECDALSSMQLTNNGTQLGRYDLSKLEGINIIAISIDSVDEKTFEILRYGAKLNQLLENVNKLRETLPNTVLQWCVVVNRLNITQLVDIYKAAQNYGINYVTFNDVYGYEDDKVIQLLRLRESDRNIVDQQFKIIDMLNSDNKIIVNNVISWSGFEDGEILDWDNIYDQLQELKKLKPYLDFDELNCNDKESRRIKIENRRINDMSEIRIPYCTNPFEVMFIQPDLSVSPCCASYGTIDVIRNNDVEMVWNGQNYQDLREAMFNWDMLPDYCRKCEAFMRYDYINDYWDMLKEEIEGNGVQIELDKVIVPPNYLPPEGFIEDEHLKQIIDKSLAKKSVGEENMLANNDEIRQVNINKFLENIIEKNTILDNSPAQVMIGLTNVCNLHCAFCLYCGFCMKKIEKGEMISLEAIDKLKGFLQAAGIVIPSGRGEPLAYNKFKEFMEICKETGAIQKMQLINNGTLIDRYDAQLFDGVNIFSISFDSTLKEEFELLRYGSDYNKIVTNVINLRKQLPNLIMQFNVTVNRLNMDEMVSIYKLAREIGINYVSYNSIYGAEEDRVIQLLRLRESDRKIVKKQMEQIRDLNSDNALAIIDEMTWTKYEDDAVYNKQKIFNELLQLKDITPYMDYDEMDGYEKETRRVQVENKKDEATEVALPYCTNPFCVMLVQPNQDVSPCCVSFGAIDNLKQKSVWDVWNGEEYQLLREAMFNYDMLPEYCKQCRAFTRYDYINEYIEKLKEEDKMNYDKLVIPPNYYPPTGLIRDEKVVRKIFESNLEKLYKNNIETGLDYSEISGIIDLFIKEIEAKDKEKYDSILAVKNEQLERVNQEVDELNQEVDELNQEVNDLKYRILNAKTTCYKINSSTFYRIVCALGRFVNQFIKGNREEKKKFLSICKNCIIGGKSEFTRNDGYNMVLNVCNVLDAPADISSGIITEEGIKDKSDVLPQSINPVTEKCLEQRYNKPDIIIFSVIDYDFRYQRPQHFASRFAENGHRVFYVNANFTNKESVKNLTDNLYVVEWENEICNAVYYLSDWKLHEKWFKDKANNLVYQYAIKDAIIILDYPNWVYGAEYLRKSFGFRIVVDYMDDFTGFLGTTTNVLKDNCIHMLKISDQVIASSQFLSEIAQNYTSELSIVRNGTEVKHFYQALEMETHKKRPVIGYYGAVSHWFDWDKVCYVAENMPDCDVVIIGEITEHRDKLEKYNNIKLLGEKNYKELPDHLAYFDVCLIPFDTSTDLIKATNPVKFYEYLSAGKRVVATEIPELEPYRNQYVYMSNDNETFLSYVKLCLSAEDNLKSKDECVAFAKENDWQMRYEAFADACLSSTPKVSIIVLTYNNLELNKACVESILSKTAYPNYELIILDNMSTDGTVEYLQELDKMNDPRVKIILNDRNSGFAGGNNKAIKEATGEYIMLLNNDTLVTRGWLTNAVKHLVNDEKCGMCGAVTNSIGNQAKIRVNYKNKKELDNFAYLYTSLHNNEIYTDVDRLAMFCTIVRKDIMDRFGMFDENYEIGMFEDDDYAKVVEKAGYSFYVAEDVFVHHVNNASFKKLDSKEYKEIFDKNKKYFEKKWSTKWKMPEYREGVTADINCDIII